MRRGLVDSELFHATCSRDPKKLGLSPVENGGHVFPKFQRHRESHHQILEAESKVFW